MALTCLRWFGACAGLGLLARAEIVSAGPTYRARWRWFLAMGALGYTAWAALLYTAAHRTTAVNLTVLQGSIPVLVALGAVAMQGARLGPLQVAGMGATLLGVVVTATRGDLAALARLELNRGDAFVLGACVLYAGYTLGLASRPKLPPLALLAGFAGAALASSLPLLAGEAVAGATVWPTPRGWLVLGYATLFPSLMAQLAYLRGVEVLGAARAGLFMNLVPVFGAGLAVLVLGEPFGAADALALALVVGGILAAELSARARAAG